MIAGLVDLLTWALLLTLVLRHVFFGWRWRLPFWSRWLAIAGVYACAVLASRTASLDGDERFAAMANVLGAPAGLFGGVSLSLALVVCALDWRDGEWKAVFVHGERIWLPRLIIVVALLFYPAALGLGPLDPYAWGYSEALPLPLAVGALALAAWLGGWRMSALTLTAALAAWRAHVLDSSNLWDYLLDPVLAAMLLVSGIRHRRSKG
ncbi:MAG: hypothetical protein LBF50_01045 [Azoarcus sp.]|jgi:hypothetical protein|nr:hypothetical protein [Azoarcus sp.]